jgi:hypothetical protein
VAGIHICGYAVVQKAGRGSFFPSPRFSAVPRIEIARGDSMLNETAARQTLYLELP